jgi:hypothetical protein
MTREMLRHNAREFVLAFIRESGGPDVKIRATLADQLNVMGSENDYEEIAMAVLDSFQLMKF